MKKKIKRASSESRNSRLLGLQLQNEEMRPLALARIQAELEAFHGNALQAGTSSKLFAHRTLLNWMNEYPEVAGIVAAARGKVRPSDPAAKRIGAKLRSPKTQKEEIARIAGVFEQCDGSALASAAKLGVNARTLFRWMEEFPALRAAVIKAGFTPKV